MLARVSARLYKRRGLASNLVRIRERRRDDLLRFLSTIQRAERTVATLDDEDGLIASGLIDSLAVLQIVVHLEETYGIDFATRGIEPEELRTVSSILDLIEQSVGIRVERIDAGRFDEAKAFFRRHADHDYSFTDCSSFVVMRELGLRQALTSDRHFSEAGFEALLAPR